MATVQRLCCAVSESGADQGFSVIRRVGGRRVRRVCRAHAGQSTMLLLHAPTRICVPVPDCQN
eukprot:1792757-Rhodomonas_salina.2